MISDLSEKADHVKFLKKVISLPYHYKAPNLSSLWWAEPRSNLGGGGRIKEGTKPLS